MFIVLFEVMPKPEQWERYLQLAGLLRPELVQIDGFIENERYASDVREGKLLSLSTWEDEQALVRWRAHAGHHAVQREGRFEVFADYRLRVGRVWKQSQQAQQSQEVRQSQHSQQAQQAQGVAGGAASWVTVDETRGGQSQPGARAEGVATQPETVAEAFTSITEADRRVLLASWPDEAQARGWVETTDEMDDSDSLLIEVVRDYGMHDRGEAPQYFPQVGRGSEHEPG
ncbi:MAG TPA: antibiotic biosynthesis monooxygenase [Solirubrobacteraceae bacterium]|nr:antibiotic biosynthesis monooxygenase [Solirubrobacteraceae bacterium]